MSTQITVRIPDELVAFADAQVTAGDARSRAAVVAQALMRERRHQVALADAAIYHAASGTTEPEDLTAFTSAAQDGWRNLD